MKNKSYFFFVSVLLLLGLYSLSFNLEKKAIIETKFCKDLTYEELNFIKPENFSKINLKIKFQNERSWRRLNLQDHLNAKKIGEIGKGVHYTNRKRSKAEITINNKKINCKIKARVRAHGDMLDHRDGAGLPSLNVSLDEGHIFGITKFLLLRPHTRNWGNEIFSTTLLSEIGLLSPRTSSITLEYNNYKENFTFQERIQKEFLEYNNLKEGPIFDGDERFLFIDPSSNLEFKKHKLVNENWIKENKEKMFISLTGFSKLNEIQTTYDAKYTEFVVDYATFANMKEKTELFSDIEIFDAIAFATRSEHALSMNDRIFYYDHNYKKFIPIFYDGTSKLLNKFNQLSNYKFADDKNLVEEADLIQGRVSLSSIYGAKKALVKINNIDKEKFLFKLNQRGFLVNEKKLNKILEKIKINLKKLDGFSRSRVFEIKIKNKKRILEERENYNNSVKRKFVFFDKNFNNLLECKPENINNCKIIDDKEIDLTRLLAQKSKNKKQQYLIFYGKKDSDKTFDGWYHKSFNSFEISKYTKNKVYQSENINFILYGDISYKINDKNKILSFLKNSEYGSVFLYKSDLKDWKINFENNFQNKITSRTDYNFLTGCLNIYDSKFENTSINSNNSDCEDSVHIVRSVGEINILNVNNSKFDGIDLDFSNLKIKKIDINYSENDCLDLSYGNYEIKSVKVKKCGDKGISVGENSDLKINNLTAKEVNTGVASKDYSKVVINNLIIDTVKDCISAYNKKQEFSGGFIDIKTMNCSNYENLRVQDNSSKILIN